MAGEVSIQPLLLFIACSARSASSISAVSIQPLLLFIIGYDATGKPVTVFQYNPCYCLSRFLHNAWYARIVSIQPLLLFIPSI